MPPTAALTSANVSVLNNEDDDDEDIPLSTLKIRAQSEVGLSSISSRPSQSLNGNRSTTGGSSVGSASRGTANESSRRITLNPSSWNFASSKSTSMTRSLSAFSVISNVDATSSRQLQTRSASSHAIHTMSSSIDRPEGVSLSSLIELEKARLQFNFPTIQKKASTSSSKPSESSDGSFPSTPSDTKSASNRVKRASTLFPGNVTYLSPIGDRSSPKKANKKAVPASQNGTTDIRGEMSRHSKTLSVPLAPTNNTEGTLSSATRDRHRQEARRSGMLPVQSIAHKPFVQNVNASVATGSSLSPQALQGLPPPPGVDPTLYASRKWEMCDMLKECFRRWGSLTMIIQCLLIRNSTCK